MCDQTLIEMAAIHHHTQAGRKNRHRANWTGQWPLWSSAASCKNWLRSEERTAEQGTATAGLRQSTRRRRRRRTRRRRSRRPDVRSHLPTTVVTCTRASVHRKGPSTRFHDSCSDLCVYIFWFVGDIWETKKIDHLIKGFWFFDFLLQSFVTHAAAAAASWGELIDSKSK